MKYNLLNPILGLFFQVIKIITFLILFKTKVLGANLQQGINALVYIIKICLIESIITTLL